MATAEDHKKLAEARLNSVKILMDAGDWDMAGYLMGYILECALKAATCHTLRQEHYPDNLKDDQARNFFQTHRVDRLLLVSGMSDIFNLSANENEVWKNWSDFTFHYPPNWPEKRYQRGYWKEDTVRQCYTCLTDEKNGILAQFKEYGRW